MTVLFRIMMMFVGYVWACIAASLVLALGTLTPQWNAFFASFGLQSPQAQSAAMWTVVGLGALVIFAVGLLPTLLIIVITEGFALRSVVIYGVIGGALALAMAYGLNFGDAIAAADRHVEGAIHVGKGGQRRGAGAGSVRRRRHCRRHGLLAVRRAQSRFAEMIRPGSDRKDLT